MEIVLDKRFKKHVEGRFGKYDLQVGVLKDSAHKFPRSKKDGLKDFAGKTARKVSGKLDGKTNAQISKDWRERLGFNYLTKPFSKRSDDIIKFSTQFFKVAFGRSEPKRLENLLQAIVRNPITRGDYGQNSKKTAKTKGFDWLMVDTGQLFKAIVAKVTVRNV